MISKSEQRAYLRSQITALSMQEKVNFSELIVDRFLKIPKWGKYKTYFLFSSMSSEPQIAKIFLKLRALDKEVAFPIWDRVRESLIWIRVDHEKDLKQKTGGILEPDFCLDRVLDEPRADLILIPGLGFDRQGFRIGRGAGMYDRTLAKVRPDCQKIGLFFSLQEVPQIVREDHDQSLDGVITEKETILYSN